MNSRERNSRLSSSAVPCWRVLPGHASPRRLPPLMFRISRALITHDYAKVRRRFRTKLLQKGPGAGQIRGIGHACRMASKIFYRSGAGGELELAAWVSEIQARARTQGPAVLFLHGGNAMGAGQWQLLKPYAEAGFVVLMPSVAR